MEEVKSESSSSSQNGEIPSSRISGPQVEQKHSGWCSYEKKLRAVKLYLEEGIPSHIVAKEIGVCHGTVFQWVRIYSRYGEDGLKPKGYSMYRWKNVHPAVKARITSVKKSNPTFGVKRISQMLGRVFMMRASRETVRRTLHKARLIKPRKKKSKRGPRKLHFFEAKAPNRMWQSDITRFRILRNENAYLIGFIDDHSRYITGLGVYMLQKSENVLEVYRRAVGEYGAPKEMLTDNGRQYVNWRGKTEFERELKKDGVHHIRSAPHHPKTLGKIERFWKTIKEEFLDKAEFENFEQARERIEFWVKYYNRQRPHQGIDGACPADRFFNIQACVKDVIEKGIEENLQDLAIKGRTEKPVYLVGRVGDNEVVVRSDKGKLRMSVDGADQGPVHEVIIGGDKHDDTGEGEKAEENMQCAGKGTGDIKRLVGEKEAVGSMQGAVGKLGGGERLGEAGNTGDVKGLGIGSGKVRGTDGAGRAAGEPAGSSGEVEGRQGNSGLEIMGGRHEKVQCDGEVPGGINNMGGEAKRPGNMQENGDELGVVKPVAGSGDGGYAVIAGTEVEGCGTMSCAGEEAQAAAGQAGCGKRGQLSEACEAAGDFRGESCGEITPVKEEKVQYESERLGRSGAVMDGENHTGRERADEGKCRSQADEREPENLLPEKKTGSSGDAGGSLVEGRGASESTGGCGEGGAPGKSVEVAGGSDDPPLRSACA